MTGSGRASAVFGFGRKLFARGAQTIRPALAAVRAWRNIALDNARAPEETQRMINKIVQSMADAMAGIEDGATVLIGGFGAVGQPNALIDGLIEQGATDLTVAANNAGVGHIGLARLMELGRVRKIICSFPRSSDPVVFEGLYRAGKIELEIVPQGTLAERMRAAGAGVPAFFTATGVGTKMGMGKENREFDGRSYVMERALEGDVGLVEAWEADRWGNLTFRESGRNFNPVIAMAAKLTIVQTQHVRELGEIDPDHVVTPGIFVDRVLHVPYGDPTGF
jgi:3-oxoadipate CoA-transferase alpha subunit